MDEETCGRCGGELPMAAHYPFPRVEHSLEQCVASLAVRLAEMERWRAGWETVELERSEWR